jgi:hypothetical protein
MVTRNGAVRRKIKEIRDRNRAAARATSDEVLKMMAELELEHDPEFVWTELQLQERKAKVAELYNSKLSPLGVDLYAPKLKLTMAVQAADIFAVAGMTSQRFSVERGRKIPGLTTRDAYLKIKFAKHRTDFDPPLADAAAYWQRAVALAESEDPNVISFYVKQRNSLSVPIGKYDPIHNEYLLVGAGHGSTMEKFVTFYRPRADAMRAGRPSGTPEAIARYVLERVEDAAYEEFGDPNSSLSH